MDTSCIIIVSSDEEMCVNLQERLQPCGYHVVAISDGEEETLAAIESLEPSLILSDIRTTWTRGALKTWELLQSTYNIPILYLTENLNPENLHRMKTGRASGFILLPCEDWQLLATIDTTIHRYRLENTVRESQKWFYITLSSIGEGVIATDEQGSIQFMNPVASELTGWSYEHALGKPLQDIFTLQNINSPDWVNPLHVQPAINPHRRTDFDGLLLARTGTTFPVEANATLIHDDRGKSFGTVLVFRDVSKQREDVQEIRRQASRAEALARVASQLTKQIELEKVFQTICVTTTEVLNARATAVFLMEPGKEILGSRAAYIRAQELTGFESHDIEIAIEQLENVISVENPVVFIPDVQTELDGKSLDLMFKYGIHQIVIAGLFSREKLTGALITVMPDHQKTIVADDIMLMKGLADQASSVIENAELFEQVRRSRERQRKLAKSLVAIQEAERRHIAKDLHDHLGQVLTGLQFMLEGVKNRVRGKSKTDVADIQAAVADVIQRVQEMSLNLRPGMLDDMGLITTLEWHFARYTSQTGIRVKFQHEEIVARIPTEIETTAYRIIQESLTNVAKYAQVTEVFVGLTIHEDSLWLEILDKGKGFDVAKIMEHPSSGIGGMRERASLAGGYLVVKSYLNQGSQIVAALPLLNTPIERRKHDRKNPPG